MFTNLDLEGQIGYVKGLRKAADKANRVIPLLMEANLETARYNAARYARLYATTLRLLADYLDPIANPPECWHDDLESAWDEDWDADADELSN